MTPQQEQHPLFMIKLPTNLTIRNAEPVLESSKISANPAKIIQGYYIAPDSPAGLSTQDWAKRLAESFKNNEVMFDIMLHTTMQARICGQMYEGGNYGGFWFIAHYGVTYFYKNGGIWYQKDL